MNKKGSILDAIYITVIILALFLGFTASRIVWDSVTESGDIANNVVEAERVIGLYDDHYIPAMDNWFVFAIIGSYISVFILAFFIRATPAFIPIMVILTTIGTVLSTFVANAHNELMKSAIIASTTADWTMMTYLIETLPFITFFFMVGLTITMLSLGDTI